MTDNNNLLPCPFCGGEAEIIEESWEDDTCRISCKKCQCYTNKIKKIHSTKQWNTRVESEVSRYKNALKDTASVLDTILKDAELRASDDGFTLLYKLKEKITKIMEDNNAN